MTTPTKDEYYCLQCQRWLPTHLFPSAKPGPGRKGLCVTCDGENATLGRRLKIATGERKSLAAAAVQLERDATASKINLPAISELADGMFREFGGVAEVCRVARDLFQNGPTCSRCHQPSAKVQLDVLKFITNLLLAAHEKEGQMSDLDEMTEQDLDDTIIQLAELRGWKFVRPEVA